MKPYQCSSLALAHLNRQVIGKVMRVAHVWHYILTKRNQDIINILVFIREDNFYQEDHLLVNYSMIYLNKKLSSVCQFLIRRVPYYRIRYIIWGFACIDLNSLWRIYYLSFCQAVCKRVMMGFRYVVWYLNKIFFPYILSFVW